MSIVLLLAKALITIVIGFAAVLGAAALLSGGGTPESAQLCEAVAPRLCIFTIL